MVIITLAMCELFAFCSAVSVLVLFEQDDSTVVAGRNAFSVMILKGQIDYSETRNCKLYQCIWC